MILCSNSTISAMPPRLMKESTHAIVSLRNRSRNLCSLPTSTASGICTFRKYDTYSSGRVGLGALPKADATVDFPSEVVEGDLGTFTSPQAALSSPTLLLLTFFDDSLLLKVKVLLRGRARLVLPFAFWPS